MLYSFLISFVDDFTFLNVFKYITFRTGLSLMTSMFLIFIVGGPLINFLERKKITGPIREDGPEHHIFKKIGTPTMGGVLILIGILFGNFLWADLSNNYIWILLFVCSSFGILGAFDDYLKIKKGNSAGISYKLKLIIQIALSVITIFFLIKFTDHPLLKEETSLTSEQKKALSDDL